MILYKHGLYVVGCRLREPADGRTLGEAEYRCEAKGRMGS
jgi:hypothetical protein